MRPLDGSQVGARQDFRQIVALLIGSLYITLGALGFAVMELAALARDSHATLFWVGVNPLHNVLHLLFGTVLLVASASALSITTKVNLTLGTTFLVLSGIGLTGYLNFLSVRSGLAPGFWLHLFTGIGLVLAGPRTRLSMTTAATTAAGALRKESAR